MNSQRTSRKVIEESARLLSNEVIRRPVKEAVREALREESVTVRSATESTATVDDESATRESERSGRSRLGRVGAVLAVVGVAYLARRRMASSSGSTWSKPSSDAVVDDEESGHVSDGATRTTETEGEVGEADR